MEIQLAHVVSVQAARITPAGQSILTHDATPLLVLRCRSLTCRVLARIFRNHENLSRPAASGFVAAGSVGSHHYDSFTNSSIRTS